MKRPGLPPRRAWIRRSTVAKKRRTPSEFARIYHSRARVRWVKSLPCLICGQGPCDNAHTENGGMSRKADYQTIVPRAEQYEEIFRWLLGESGEFPESVAGRRYSFRTELRARLRQAKSAAPEERDDA